MAASDYPIIYVRGYAMRREEMDDTIADPFCGFNLGSTVFRQTADKNRQQKFVFESPVIRLRTDFGYEAVYNEGLDIIDPGWSEPISRRSIVIYRYYESASTLLGSGETPKIDDFAKGLSALILRVRDLVGEHKESKLKPEDFRCYLVAHSMGGLVCRAFLQNPEFGAPEARRCVDKMFTYATPHNGIDMVGLNVPSWIGMFDLNTFNRKQMARYLNLEAEYQETERVDWIPEKTLPSRRCFNMVGSNRADYAVAGGASSALVGQGSDGLVRIDNAAVWGRDVGGHASTPCATAYCYRSHSGYFGIVNSEEAYQNLTRFLFGDVRVDIWLDVEGVRLPAEIREEEAAGKTITALYQIEILASPRAKRWYLTRRLADEDSAACRSYEELKAATTGAPKAIYLSSIFLAKSASVDPKKRSLAYQVDLAVRAPDYEVDRKFWPNKHYEGAALFRDAVVVELVPPTKPDGDWAVAYDWQSDNVGQATTPITGDALAKGGIELKIGLPSDPKSNPKAPAISGTLRLRVSSWNT